MFDCWFRRQISRTQFIFTMYNGLQCLPVEINYSYLCIRFGKKFGIWNECARQSKFPCRPIHGSDLIDSNVDLFMYSIEGISFCTWKTGRFHWAWVGIIAIEDWKNANSLFKRCFRCRRRPRILRSAVKLEANQCQNITKKYLFCLLKSR